LPRSLPAILKDPLLAVFSALITLPAVHLLVADRRYFEALLIAHLVWFGGVLIQSRVHSGASTLRVNEEVEAALVSEPAASDAPVLTPVAEPEPITPTQRILDRVRARLQALELPGEMEDLLTSYFRLAIKARLNLAAVTPTIQVAAAKCEAVQQQVVSVEKIALETKLLALNDAFDAAASGESGRGFGMVAKEVGRVSHSASRVSEAIELEMNAISGTANKLAAELNGVSFAALAHCYENDTEVRGLIHQIEFAGKRLKQQLGRALTLLSDDRQSNGSFTQNRTDPVVGTVVNQLQEDIGAMLEVLDQINADLLALHLHPLRLLPDVGRLKTIVEAVVEEAGLE